MIRGGLMPRRLAAALALALLATAPLASAQSAGPEAIRGEASFSSAGGYARLVLKLAEDVPCQITSAGSILVIRFERPVDIAVQMKPQKMSDVLGLMQPEAAERLTVELARRAGGDKSSASAELPKIEGKVLPQK